MPLDVEALNVFGHYLRQVPHRREPYFRALPPPDNRWQRGAIVEAMYLADTEATAWAEWYRHLAELGLPPMQDMPRDLWEWEVKQVRVANLTTGARLARVGLPLPAPGRHTWSAFQAVGEQLWGEGWSGVLAPSAALPLGRVLCLYRSRWPIPPPTTHHSPPAPPVGMAT